MLDRLTGMQVFTKVAATGSFSAAARQLGMSQSMATKHVAAIEHRLGVRLLHRSTRRLSLTEAGRIYLNACERVLADVEEVEATARAQAAEPRGLLRLNVPLSFGLAEIAPLVPAFMERHPAIAVEIGLSDRVVDLVEEGWDLAVRIGRLRSSSLLSRRLGETELLLCGSPAYFAERGRPRTTADLADHECLGYTLPDVAAAGRWLLGRDGRTVVPVKGRLSANNGDALRIAARAGIGLVLQPSFIVADDLRAGRLEAIRLGDAETSVLGIHAVQSGDRRQPAKVRRFVEFLIERWSPAPPWRDAELMAASALTAEDGGPSRAPLLDEAVSPSAPSPPR